MRTLLGRVLNLSFVFLISLLLIAATGKKANAIPPIPPTVELDVVLQLVDGVVHIVFRNPEGLPLFRTTLSSFLAEIGAGEAAGAAAAESGAASAEAAGGFLCRSTGLYVSVAIGTTYVILKADRDLNGNWIWDAEGFKVDPKSLQSEPDSISVSCNTLSNGAATPSTLFACQAALDDHIVGYTSGYTGLGVKTSPTELTCSLYWSRPGDPYYDQCRELREKCIDNTIDFCGIPNDVPPEAEVEVKVYSSEKIIAETSGGRRSLASASVSPYCEMKYDDSYKDETIGTGSGSSANYDLMYP